MDEPSALEKAARMTGRHTEESDWADDADGVPEPPGSGADESGLASGGLETEDSTPT